MSSLAIHVVGFDFGDWKSRVPKEYDLLLDVREFIGRGDKRHGHTSVLHNSKLKNELGSKKGVQDCITFLKEKMNKINKKNKTIIIGCAKGRHRSPTVAMELKEELENKMTITIIYHYTK